jgi:hypothetical protein
MSVCATTARGFANHGRADHSARVVGSIDARSITGAILKSLRQFGLRAMHELDFAHND